jgi:hypothetical protein
VALHVIGNDEIPCSIHGWGSNCRGGSVATAPAS